MRIVAIHNHDSFNADLCTIPDTEWYHLVNDKNGHICWGGGSREKPDNLHALPYKDLEEIDWKQFDVCMVHSLDRWAFLKDVSIPKIYLEHTVPFPLWGGPAVHTEIAKKAKVVFLSEAQVNAWQFPSFQAEVIAPCIDVNSYPEWNPDRQTVLTVVNNLPERNWCCGYDIWRMNTQGFPRTLIGEGNELVAKNPLMDEFQNPPTDFSVANPNAVGFCKGAIVTDHLVHSAVYFNTNTHSAIGTSLLEAMAVGIPIVAVDKWAAHLYLVDQESGGRKKSGILSNVQPVLRQALWDVLKDPCAYRTMGASARNSARDFFDPERFIDQWTTLLVDLV